MADTNLWMTDNKLKLNTEKTELLVLHSRFHPYSSLSSLTIGNDTIQPSDQAYNIVVIFDSALTLSKHVGAKIKGAFYALKNIARIRSYLSSETTKILVHALVISKIDNCNALLYDLPKNLTDQLQRVQNAAAWVIAGVGKREHVTPILEDLHWLPVELRIIFTVNLLAYRNC